MSATIELLPEVVTPEGLAGEWRWARAVPVYGPAYVRLYVGKWMVGSVSHSIFKSKGSTPMFSVSTRLPGLKPDLGEFQSEADAKARLLKAVAHWFSGVSGTPSA